MNTKKKVCLASDDKNNSCKFTFSWQLFQSLNMSQLHTSVGFMGYFENTVRLLSGRRIGNNENQLNQVAVSM